MRVSCFTLCAVFVFVIVVFFSGPLDSHEVVLNTVCYLPMIWGLQTFEGDDSDKNAQFTGCQKSLKWRTEEIGSQRDSHSLGNLTSPNFYELWNVAQ